MPALVRPSMKQPTFRQRIGSLIAGRERKESAVMRAIIPVGNTAPRWTQTNYEAVAREGYGRNPYVFGAITQISMAIAGIRWKVYKDQTKKVAYDKHPMLDLLNRPNPREGKTKFFENFMGFLLLDGNNFVNAVGPAGKPPLELWNLRPDRVSIVYGTPLDPIKGYIYQVGSVKVALDAAEVRHFKSFSPIDDFRGMSPMQAAAMSVDQSNASKAWNVGLLQNGAQPTGAMVTSETLDPDQYQRMKTQISEDYGGFANAGRPLLLEGGVTWQEMGLSPRDMSWLEGQRLSSREIAIVMNIAPELIGDSSNKTYSNYGEARVALYQENALPKCDWIRDELNAWLSPMYPDVPYCDYDKEDIEALQEDRDALWDRADKAFVSGWITLGQSQKMVGEDVDPKYGDMYIWELPQRPPAQTAIDAASANLQAAQLNAANQPATVTEEQPGGGGKQPPQLTGGKNPPDTEQPQPASPRGGAERPKPPADGKVTNLFARGRVPQSEVVSR